MSTSRSRLRFFNRRKFVQDETEDAGNNPEELFLEDLPNKTRYPQERTTAKACLKVKADQVTPPKANKATCRRFLPTDVVKMEGKGRTVQRGLRLVDEKGGVHTMKLYNDSDLGIGKIYQTFKDTVAYSLTAVSSKRLRN